MKFLRALRSFAPFCTKRPPYLDWTLSGRRIAYLGNNLGPDGIGKEEGADEVL